jgi:hypothetical protein
MLPRRTHFRWSIRPNERRFPPLPQLRAARGNMPYLASDGLPSGPRRRPSRASGLGGEDVGPVPVEVFPGGRLGGGREENRVEKRRAPGPGVLGTEGLRSRFESAGADFSRYRYAPDNDTPAA